MYNGIIIIYCRWVYTEFATDSGSAVLEVEIPTGEFRFNLQIPVYVFFKCLKFDRSYYFPNITRLSFV